jgi:membrane protease YdiL (CAAX protease family)
MSFLDTSRAGRQAWRELAEIAVAYALTEGALWSLGWAQLIWSAAAVLWVTLATAASRRSSRQLGLRISGAHLLFWATGTAAVIGGLMILSGWYVGSAHGLHAARPFIRVLLYSVWALAQEFLAQSFMFVRFEAVLGGRWAVLCTAVLFSLAHIPNPVLMPATLVAGLVFAWAFRRYRNVYAVGLAHALLGLAVAVSFPDGFVHHMRVGAAYGTYLLGIYPMFFVDR